MTDMSPADVVRRVRLRSGVTRHELARLADVPPELIADIEAGVAEVDPSILAHIAHAGGFRLVDGRPLPLSDPAVRTAARSVLEGATCSGDAAEWSTRFRRAWPDAGTDVEQAVALLGVAGLAGSFGTVGAHNVETSLTMQEVATEFERRGVRYAVTGIAAYRRREHPESSEPAIYVDDPHALDDLPADGPTRRIALLQMTPEALDGAVRVGGIWYVAAIQGIVDAAARGGRQPDKADAALRSWMASRAR